VVLVSALLLPLPAVRAESPVAAAFPGDELWAGRSAGATGSAALPASIDAALDAYQKSVKENGANLEARWRLMRAYYFKGEYTTADPEQKKRIFDEGKRAGEETLVEIRTQLGKKSGKKLEKATPVELVPLSERNIAMARCFLWAGVNWGKWSLVFGKTAAVKQGAATKIRDYATAVISMNPALEDAGGYRLLGRLHHQTPSVPFFTGWASREEALKNLREAVRLAPASLINRQYLAEAIWDYDKVRRAEARASLQAIIAATPSPEFLIEDLRTQEEARATLAAWQKP
jgi:tetratricopeptide (TPR) repeat protein